MPKDKIKKPNKTRVSPINTHLREMQAEAAKRAADLKLWNEMQAAAAKAGGRWTE